jgi:hypothetical protein
MAYPVLPWDSCRAAGASTMTVDLNSRGNLLRSNSQWKLVLVLATVMRASLSTSLLDVVLMAKSHKRRLEPACRI